MILSDMLVETRSIINETDANNSHFTDAVLTAWINEGYRFVETRIGVIPVKQRDYTCASSITLNSRCLTINQAFILNPTSGKYDKLSVIDLESLKSLDPSWPSADTGVPQYFVRKDTFTAMPYPPPDSSYTGQNIRTYGMEFQSDLALSNDVPDLPLNMHDLLPHYAAYRAFQQLQRPQDATNELILVNTQMKAQQNMTTKFSEERMQWRWADDT